MRLNVAAVDQLVYTWRHHGRRAALAVARQRLRHTVGKRVFTYQYPNVEWGRNVEIKGKLVIRGTGTVVIGDDVTFDDTDEPVQLIVGTPDAMIVIGDRCGLSGTVIVAAGSIRIGRGCILARSRISDNDWHAMTGDRRDAGTIIDPLPVTFEDNVWLGAGSMVSRGVTVGAGAVIGAGSIIRTDVAPDSVVIGNPQRKVGELEQATSSALETAKVIELIEESTQSIPGTIDASTPLDVPDLWDSLSVVTFLSMVQDETGLELAVDDLWGCATPADLAASITRRLAS